MRFLLKVLLFSSLVAGVVDAFSDSCTVSTLINGLDEDAINKDTLKSNMAKFNTDCGGECVLDNIKGVLRYRCSKNFGAKEYAVYRCPSNRTQYYILSTKSCRIKHYTLCNETASYQDPNLNDVVKDLLCSCEEYTEYSVTEGRCVHTFNQSDYVYCKTQRQPEIKLSKTCTMPHECEDGVDVDSVRFNCDSQGIYCLTNEIRTFVHLSMKCNEKAECDNKEDEMNCPTTDEQGVRSGLYCDQDEDTPVKYIKEKKICDKFYDCDNKRDESSILCPNDYCPSKADPSKTIWVTKDMECNGVTDCEDARDEQPENCPDVYDYEGFQCDDDTKWVHQQYACTGRNICVDGADDDGRWNCEVHELCGETSRADPNLVLCNSTFLCTDASIKQKGVCKFCADGGLDDVERCRKEQYSDRGMVCMDIEESPFGDYEVERFVANLRICDGTKDCDADQEDEKGCTNGVYCSEDENKLIPWENLCNPTISVQCSPTGCDSEFFAHLKDKDPDFTLYSEYLNMTFLQQHALPPRNLTLTEEDLSYMVKHRIFACQPRFYNLDGPKAKILEDVIEEQCISPDKFRCDRKHSTEQLTNNTIMKEWLCDWQEYCGTDSVTIGASMTKITKCRSSGYCYNELMKCDNVDDCKGKVSELDDSADRTDEIGCSGLGLPCGNGDYVEDIYICDGYDDCKVSGVDEKICDQFVEATVDKCSNRTEKFALYSIYKHTGAATDFSLEQVMVDIPVDCDCSLLSGSRFLAAVCNTIPGESNQACSNNKTGMYNNTLCYSGEWFTTEYDTIDESCKKHTKAIATFSGSSPNDMTSFMRYENVDTANFVDKSVFCNNPNQRKDNKCGVPLSNMCDLKSDCGDWSDEDSRVCTNNFECKNQDNVTESVIPISKTCDGVSHCANSQDECLDRCSKDSISTNTKILGDNPALLVVVWIFGVISLIFNFILIISMTKTAFEVLDKIPHRFIYRILVSTIAIGDIMVSIYLVMLACVDTFRGGQKYCETKETWLTGFTCIMMGVLSTFGNHVSLLAMVSLSLFRLKTVVNYMWPRSVNKVRAIRLALLLIALILLVAILISTLPLAPLLKDYFVDRYYFPNRRSVFNRGRKVDLLETIKIFNAANSSHPLPDPLTNLTATSSWDSLLTRVDHIFNTSKITTHKKQYSFYSAYGFCLFNYLNKPENISFYYVITIIAVNLICFITIIASYIYIWKVGTKSKSTERQLQKKLSIAVFLNILCRLPLFTICVVHLVGAHEEVKGVYSQNCTGTCLYYRYMSVFVIPINSVLNPFINSETPLLQMLGCRLFAKRNDITDTTRVGSGGRIKSTVPAGTLNTCNVQSHVNANVPYRLELSNTSPPVMPEEETTTL